VDRVGILAAKRRKPWVDSEKSASTEGAKEKLRHNLSKQRSSTRPNSPIKPNPRSFCV